MFKSEKDLVDSLLLSLSLNKLSIFNLGRYDYMHVMKEVSVGHGIADIVLLFFNNYEKRKTSFEIPEITIMELVKSSANISLDEIKGKTGLSYQRVQQAITKLKDENYLTTFDGLLYLDKEYKTFLQKTISIEAKLKNWKRALIQAYRYKWFSDLAYVCLPNSESSLAKKNIDEFCMRNVGLFTVDDHGKIEIIFNPEEDKPYSAKMSMLLNEKVMTSMNSSG